MKPLADNLLTHDEMLAVGANPHDVADLVEAGEIVRLARSLYVQRGQDSHGSLDYAIACKIGGGVLRGPTAGSIHGLTDDIPHAIHLLVPEGRRIEPCMAGVNIPSRGTRQPRNVEIGVEQIRIDPFHPRVTDKARTVVESRPLGQHPAARGRGRAILLGR